MYRVVPKGYNAEFILRNLRKKLIELKVIINDIDIFISKKNPQFPQNKFQQYSHDLKFK